MRTVKPFLLCLLTLGVLASGCKSVVKYPPMTSWGPNVQTLGVVKADSGRWPLSLNVPPPEYTFQDALRTKAADTYKVTKSEVVLDEVTVSFTAEMVGTIRKWEASAMSGRIAATNGR